MLEVVEDIVNLGWPKMGEWAHKAALLRDVEETLSVVCIA